MIILLIWYLTIITIILLLSQIRLSVHNIKNVNYVKVKFMIFTMYLDYERFIRTLKKLGIRKDITLKKQLEFYLAMNPIFKDIVNQTVIEKAKFYKFFDEYSQTYKVVTFYLLSSYLNSFLEFNCKKTKNFQSEIIYSNDREDLDFSFICKISILNLIYVFGKNIKVLFKYFKRRFVHGS